MNLLNKLVDERTRENETVNPVGLELMDQIIERSLDALIISAQTQKFVFGSGEVSREQMLSRFGNSLKLGRLLTVPEPNQQALEETLKLLLAQYLEKDELNRVSHSVAKVLCDAGWRWYGD